MHKPGRPFHGCSALAAYAPLDVLLEQVVDRCENWDDDDERLWAVQDAITALEEALRRFPGTRSAVWVPMTWLNDTRMARLVAMRDGAAEALRDIKRTFGQLGDACQEWLESAGPEERIAARDQAAALQKMAAERDRRERAVAAADLAIEQNLELGRENWLALAD